METFLGYQVLVLCMTLTEEFDYPLYLNSAFDLFQSKIRMNILALEFHEDCEQKRGRRDQLQSPCPLFFHISLLIEAVLERYSPVKRPATGHAQRGT